jgi:hypothetical protein
LLKALATDAELTGSPNVIIFIPMNGSLSARLGHIVPSDVFDNPKTWLLTAFAHFWPSGAGNARFSEFSFRSCLRISRAELPQRVQLSISPLYASLATMRGSGTFRHNSDSSTR